MAAASAEKQYNNFTAGLITEASPLTFPDNSALDISNLVLERSGKVSRRLGINFEIGYNIIASGISQSTINSSRVSFHKWLTPNGGSAVVIGIIRIHNKLWFINLNSNNPSTLLLNGGNALTIAGLTATTMSTDMINNYLVIVASSLDTPILLTYNANTDIVSQEIVPIQVRDIWGVVDTIPIDSRPATLTQTHNYNLVNQGWLPGITSVCGTASTDTVKTTTAWVQIKTGADLAQAIVDGVYQFGVGSSGYWKTSTVITPGAPISIGAVECTKTKIGVYPSNCDIWTLGKVADVASVNFEKYDPDSLKRNSIYKVEAPKGALILDAYDRGGSRKALTGLTTLPNDIETGRLTTVASFSGRMFYSGIASNISGADDKSPNYTGYVFFSQVATSKDQLGKCFQDSDPTSPTINDIVATDGGTIQIPEATRIWRLLSTRVSLLVFAENGVWEIFGDTGGFSATSFQLSKVTPVGTNSTYSVIDTPSGVLYWAKSGIFILTQNQVSGRYQAENLSITTIQTLYNRITDTSRQFVRGYYEQDQNRVRWFYNTESDYGSLGINRYNKELILDLTLKSFYLNDIFIDSQSPYVADYADIPKFVSDNSLDSVYVGIDPVLVGTEEVVVPDRTPSTTRDISFKFLTMIGTSFTLSEYNNDTFRDWVSYNGTGYNYSSFIITGFELYGDMIRKKQVPYLIMALQRTETGFTQTSDGLVLENPSSCLVQAQWNWANSAASGKWGPQFQTYKLSRFFTPVNSLDTFDTGDSVITSKNKLRGTGKCLSLYISSEENKDMRILGWGTTLTGGAKV